MKKLSIFILLMAGIVTGCTTRVYDSNMELGKNQLKEENYQEAYEAFELAYDDNATEEVKELTYLSSLLSKGMKKYKDQDMEGAKAVFLEAVGYKAKFKEGKTMIKKANDMIKETEKASLETTEESTVPGETGVEENGTKVDSAPQVEAKDEPAVEKEMPKEEKEKEKNDQENPVKEDATAKEKGSDQTLSKAAAEQLVKDFIKFDEYPQLQIQYDHDDEKGDYIFQVFEVVNDSKEGGHTATWGWYGVNKKTKEVYEQM